MEPAGCPSRDTLAAHMLGRLSDQQSREIAHHLGRCPRCEAVADEVEGVQDALVGLLRTPPDDHGWGSG